MEKRCSYIVAGEYPSHQCRNKAKVEREGTSYCGVHDPVYIKEKDRKWKENFDKRFSKDMARAERTVAMRNACEGLTTQELERLTPGLLRQASAKAEEV